MRNVRSFLFVFILGFTPLVWADNLENLYEEIIDQNYREKYPTESARSFKVHLLDSYTRFPPLAKIESQAIAPFAGSKLIQGTIKYVGFFKKAYKYDLYFDGVKYIFQVKVHFRNGSTQDNLLFDERLTQAQHIWNSYKIGTDFGYEFRFSREPNAAKAHYKVFVLDSTRGPYDTYWGRDWSGHTVAHELGHMMGLGDEYETLSGDTRCLLDSFMCRSYAGRPMTHHYYFILRRLL